MGKNQAYKAMQRAKLGSTSGGPEEIEDGMMDGSFHSPEWHAARLASLNTSHTITWEEFKKKRKEDELKKGELEADKDKMMREYRAQLDAERAHKLLGRNHHSSKSHNKKEKKEKETKKRSCRKRKHRRRSSESSSSSSSSESSDSEEETESKKSRTKSRSKKSRKERKHRSRAKHSSSDSESDGPLPLSRFFAVVKS